jgi:hypothetical protein
MGTRLTLKELAMIHEALSMMLAGETEDHIDTEAMQSAHQKILSRISKAEQARQRQTDGSTRTNSQR